ncbi:unnamed protein product [Larinioides sclopetarius]|uniref:C2H2-type domain-containing protein n=1 Tax=Larinioides sclopetarius TaxID=280406 RepID=A0AAV2AL73_9ARAC
MSGKYPSSSNRRCNWRLPSLLENSLDTQSRHRFQCSQCPYGTASNADLKKHILTHTGEKPHACNVCGRGFALKENLKRHYITHLNDKAQSPKPKWKLKIQESTKIKVSGVKKAGTQTPEEAMSIIYDETYDCPEPHCSYSTPSRRQFQKHMLIHSDQRPYSCFVCNYTFKRSDSLRQHLLTHSGEKPYACTLVSSIKKFKGKKFIDNVELGNFNKIRFECLICPYVTGHYSDIRNHISQHSRFKCYYCGQSFSRKETLKTHMNRHTDIDTPLVNSLEALLDEICSEHSDRIIPKSEDDDIQNSHEKCTTMLQPEDDATEIATIQNYNITPDEIKNGGIKYVCNTFLCHYETSSKALYQTHLRSHSEMNSFFCHVCYEKFETKDIYKRHMGNHPGEKPYACDFCPLKYAHESSLKRHMKGTHDSQQDLQDLSLIYNRYDTVPRFSASFGV